MKKKVLFVTNHFTYSNGVATVLRSIIQNINSEKYDIYLLPIYRFDSDFASCIKDKFTLVKGFGFYFRGFDKIVNMMSSKALYKRFVKDHYDVEISFQFGIPTKMMSNSTNENTICWMHTFDSKMKLKKYYQKYAKMVNVSRIGMEKLIKEGFNSQKCTYCYNIIDEDFINNKRTEAINISKTRKFSIITVARMDPDKAFLRYVECINSRKEYLSNYEFWLIGDGLEREKVEKYVQDNHLSEFVKVLGKQTNPYSFMAQSDLYFCPSYREGFSTACQEAAILGLPVFSTDVDGAAELIEEAECGEVFENSEQGIESFLDKLANSSDLIDGWKTIATNNKSKFFKEKRIQRIENTIDFIV